MNGLEERDHIGPLREGRSRIPNDPYAHLPPQLHPEALNEDLHLPSLSPLEALKPAEDIEEVETFPELQNIKNRLKELDAEDAKSDQEGVREEILIAPVRASTPLTADQMDQLVAFCCPIIGADLGDDDRAGREDRMQQHTGPLLDRQVMSPGEIDLTDEVRGTIVDASAQLLETDETVNILKRDVHALTRERDKLQYQLLTSISRANGLAETNCAQTFDLNNLRRQLNQLRSEANERSERGDPKLRSDENECPEWLDYDVGMSTFNRAIPPDCVVNKLVTKANAPYKLRDSGVDFECGNPNKENSGGFVFHLLPAANGLYGNVEDMGEDFEGGDITPKPGILPLEYGFEHTFPVLEHIPCDCDMTATFDCPHQHSWWKDRSLTGTRAAFELLTGTTAPLAPYVAPPSRKKIKQKFTGDVECNVARGGN